MEQYPRNARQKLQDMNTKIEMPRSMISQRKASSIPYRTERVEAEEEKMAETAATKSESKKHNFGNIG